MIQVLLKPCLCKHKHITVGKGPVGSMVVACNEKNCYVMVRGNNEVEAIWMWQHMRRPNDGHQIFICKGCSRFKAECVCDG